uniref:NADH-ubiquinone oxidoreductase chain 2 n=3 Tax=Gehyra girloorloo TaxID=2035133 RepID=A0A2H4QSE1_9SAUR|nr:NADH dehydrogenase subunit 2 [Gehyra girloorloo]ATX74632.1 NADH dehydrogenase subunit 2 [Gehyra girloorloo]ATX74633.1 NADH dehydrogenase subunit 2 [Gehyra girloorloo]ATX74635.1 NADH dehydrogenase subunit 2 [Gehyra girloorloo]
MNPIIWSILITSLSTSTIITMASHHWLLAWLGLELNTLSILPITMKHHHPRATEATTKYFLIQALAAAMILFASTTNAWQTGLWDITNSTQTTIITMAVLLKLGMAPVHLWYPEVLQGTTLNTALLISTWQKLAPLSLLYMMHNNLPNNLLLLTGLLSALVGGWAGLNQTQTRKIMAHSSIAHMGWIVIALNTTQELTTLALLTYMIMTTAMFYSLEMSKTKTITDMGTAWSSSPTMTTLTLLTLTSLGGLPPLTGFMPKLLILNELTMKPLLPLATTLALATLPSLFFYIRMTHTTTLTTPPTTTTIEHKWRFKTTPHPIHTTTTTLALLLMPLSPTLYMTT